MWCATAAQVGRCSGLRPSAAARRCRLLRGAGLLGFQRPLRAWPGLFTATARGCRLAGSDLPAPPALDPASLGRRVATVALALDLLAGVPGAVWLSQRELRRGRGGGRQGSDPALPDGALLLPDGRRIAIELDLRGGGSARLLRVCRFHARHRAFDAARYVVVRAAAAERLARAAAAYPLVTVQFWPLPPEAMGRAPQR